MAYENVPEHAGFEGVEVGDGEEAAEAVADRRPSIVTPTDEWLARISDQLQVFVDAIDEARSDDGDDEPADGSDGSDADKGTGSPDPGAPPADDKSAAKKAAAAPKKTAEVKGD